MRWVLAIVAAAGCAGGSPPSIEPSPAHGNPCLRAGRPCVDMYVVAHEDDDLLFMNPDIARSIAAGNQVIIVHVTTGDLPVQSVETFGNQPDPPDFLRYWIDRERGILNAFTVMARGPEAAFSTYAPAGELPAGWTASVIDVAGVKMPEYRLVAASGQPVVAVFMRLSDFQLWPAWNNLPGGGGQAGGVSLPAGDTITDGCDDPAVCPLGTTIPRQQLTRDQLIDAFTGLITRYATDSVSAQDATTPTKGPTPSGMYWDRLGTPSDGYSDYWDHVYSAAFVMLAATRAQAAMATTLSVRLYRDYTISQEPRNIGDGEALAKAQIFARYAVLDASIVPHYKVIDFAAPVFGSNDYDLGTGASWQHRELVTRTLLGAGPLQGRLAIAGSCVAATGDAPLLAACDAAPSWIATATNQLQLAGTASCLTVGDAGAVALAPCAPQTDSSTLFLFANGQLRSQDAQCLTASGNSLASLDCDHEALAPHATGRVIASQDFTLRFASARTFSLAPDVSTLSLAHQHACLRGGSGVACAPYADGVLAEPVPLAALPADASDVATLWDRAAGALVVCARDGGVLACGTRTTDEHAADRTLRYIDLTGRGTLDVCGRSATGLTCSLDTGGAWSAARGWSASFSDDAGWSAPAYGDTMQLADVDGDGLADTCGRSARGIVCASQLAGAFADTARWSFDEDRTSNLAHGAEDYSDLDPDEPWLSGDAYYSSFRLVDVNRDGLADACARGAAGIYCAFSTGTAFERKKLVVPDAFSDADGWGESAYGTTITWGDLEGDGRIDVCGRGAAGLVCAAGY